MEALASINLLSAVIAFIAAVIAVKAFETPAIRLGLIDRPGGRKIHARTVPLTGGASVLSGFLIASLVLPVTLTGYGLLFAGLFAVALIGVVDDAKGLSPALRFGAQLVVATVVVFAGGPLLADIGSAPWGGMLALGVLAAPVTIIALVGFSNSINMMDGADGLAGSVVVVILGFVTAAALLAGDTAIPVIAATLMAAVAGFLLFNLRGPWRQRASVFLGDSGSLALGFGVIWLVIEVAMLPDRVISPMGLAWVVAVPVIETLNLIIRRLHRGQSPFHADRDHLHHILRRAGFSVCQTTAMITALVAGLGAAGVLASAAGVGDGWLWLGLVLLAAVHFVFTDQGWRSVAAIRRLCYWREPAARQYQLTGITLPPARRGPVLAGFYLMLAALPFGLPVALIGLGLLLLGVVLPGARFSRSVMVKPTAWLVGAFFLWLAGAVLLAGEPIAVHAPVVWLSGVIALPLAWWLASEPRQLALGGYWLLAMVLLALGFGEGVMTPKASDTAAAAASLLLLLGLLLVGVVTLFGRQFVRGLRAPRRLPGLALLLSIHGSALIVILLLAGQVFMAGGAGSEALAGPLAANSSLAALKAVGGWPALLLLAALIGRCLWAVVRLWQLKLWARSWACGVLAGSVVLIAALALTPVLASLSGGMVASLGLAGLMVAALQYERAERLSRED